VDNDSSALTNKRLFAYDPRMSAVAHLEPTTRVAILDAAEQAFADRGYDGVSVREIASAAGLRNQASLYHHFDNKDAIYEAVLRRRVESLIAVVVESRREGGLLDADDRSREARIGEYLDRVVDYLVEHSHVARLIRRASLDDDATARATMERLVRPLFDEGVRLLGGAQTPWPPDQVPHLAAGLYHLIFGYFADSALLRALMPNDPSSRAAIDRQRAFLHHAVMRLIDLPTAPTHSTRGATR
jgi:AcrR family transcriptional regulator